MNLSRFNLNLLVALDALLVEKHVTRAGERIGITQSAMSSALNQLRYLFQDELLIRNPKGMVLTPRARELAPQVHQVIEQFHTLFNNQIEFDPKNSDRVFKVGMSDYMETILLPEITRVMRDAAPHIKLKVKHINYFRSDVPIDNYEIELGIVFRTAEEPIEEQPQLETETIFTVDGVCVARADHPLIQKPLTLERYLSADHIKIAYEDITENSARDNRVDRALRKLGKERKTPISVSHYLPVLLAVSKTHLIATIPDIFPKKILKELELKASKLPFKLPSTNVLQVWHKQHNNDPGHRWLREVIKKSASALTNIKL